TWSFPRQAPDARTSFSRGHSGRCPRRLPDTLLGTSGEVPCLSGHEARLRDGCGECRGPPRARHGACRARQAMGSPPLSDRHAERPARLRRLLAQPRGRRPDRGGDRCDDTRHSARVHAPDGAGTIRSSERAHLGALALFAPAHRVDPAGSPRGHRRHRQQVPAARARQARVQSDQRRPGRDDARDRRRLGVARPMGQRARVRLPAGVRRRPRGQSRRPPRRHARVPHVLPGPARAPLVLARRAARGSPAPAGDRRARAVRLLHDLGSQDDTRLTRRAPAVRGAGRARRLRRAVPVVPNQRPAVVAGRLLARRTRHRPAAARPTLSMEELAMKHASAFVAALLVVALAAPTVLAFCGFYVAKADTRLFNQDSQVVLVRQDVKSVITMANDFKCDLKEFAIVVPVPSVLEKGQIRVSDRALIDHLDAYSAPRLVEYFDEDPCVPRAMPAPATQTFSGAARAALMAERARSLGVTIEARYTVGEYDILILSARESGGLETWLRDNGYRLPAGASPVLGSYLKQGMKFFVARVNLKEQARLGFTYLR